jgi:uncharacterized protein YndB with AHSA1/START domain
MNTRTEVKHAMSEHTPEQMPPLRLSRVLHAARATVFRAWTSAEHVKRWFCPETFTIPEATVQRNVGGAFDVCMRSPAGEQHWIRGTFVEIKPEIRLVIDMVVDDSAGKKLFRAYTEVGFADALGGTRIDLVQTYTLLDPSVAWMMQGAPEGWRSTLDKLEREVVRMQGAAEAGTRSVVHAVFDLERTYDAPVARVWKALTDPAAKQKWFARGLEVLEREMDVRVGGRERVSGRWEGGMVSTFDAIYHDVVPDARLVYSYQLFLDDKKISVSLATMQLKDGGGRTTLKVTEQGAFLDGYDDAGARKHGTGLLLDALGASLTD